MTDNQMDSLIQDLSDLQIYIEFFKIKLEPQRLYYSQRKAIQKVIYSFHNDLEIFGNKILNIIEGDQP